MSALAEYARDSALTRFSKLTQEEKQSLLLGEEGHSIVMYDLECTSLKPNVGRILCASFKPLGGAVYTLGALDKGLRKQDVYDDGALARRIRDELERYDVIVGHNSRMFDTRFLNARLLRAGERIKTQQYQIDTMWAWRSKSSAWSALNAVQTFALPDAEVTKTSVEWPEWMRALGWSKKLRDAAMAEIVDHCERDVVVLEDAYRFMVERGVIRGIRRDGGIM